MRQLLEIIYEYQLLDTRQRKLGIELEDGERARLRGLSTLLGSRSPGAGSRRTMSREPLPLQALFTTPGGFESGQIKNVSGGGMLVSTANPPAPETRIILRVTDDDPGCEYFFPCRVVWRTRGAHGRMGVEFDGVPTRSTVLPDDDGPWRRSVRFGDHRVAPIVA